MARRDRERPNCACSNPAPKVTLADAWNVLSDVEGDINHAQSAHLILTHLVEHLIEDGHVVGKTEGSRLLNLTTADLDMLMHALYHVQDQISVVMTTFQKGAKAFAAARNAAAVASQAEAD
jgi:hypothetical protein